MYVIPALASLIVIIANGADDLEMMMYDVLQMPSVTKITS